MALNLRTQRIKNPAEVVQPFNEFQDDVQGIVRQLNDNPLVSGVLIRDVALSTVASLVLHGLGFEPNGWFAVNKTASFDIFEDATADNPDRKQFLNLRTSASSYTVNILIF